MADLVKLPKPLRKALRRLRLRCEYKPRLWARIVANGFRPRRVLAFPEVPLPNTTFYKLCHLHGFSLTRNPALPADLAIWWEDATVRRPCPALGQRVLNQGCGDISKSRVDAVHAEVFGYSAAIDPTTYVGPCVRKSDRNAVHDGTVLEAPIGRAEPGFVYQLLLDNRVSDGLVEDLRLYVFGGRVPLCCRSRRKLAERFSNDVVEAFLIDAREVLSEEEADRVQRFCRGMGLDYGELDAVRDASSGRLYVVDVNNTPFGPPAKVIRNLDRGQVFQTLSRPFLDMMSSSVG